jgi:O-antigen/teichoic acid export membrane protein
VRIDLNYERLPFLALFAAKGLQLANGFAVSVIVVWLYGLDSAGTLALAALPGAAGALAVSFGLPSALPRFRASQGARATVGLGVSCAAILPVLAIVIGYAFVMARSEEERIAIVALSLAGALVGQVNVQQTLYILQKRTLYAPVAPAIHLIGTVAIMMAPSFHAFALYLLGVRALGCVAGFALLTFERADLRRARPAIAETLRFAPLDIGNLLADQLPVVLLAVLLSRAELGLYGIVRQFVSVADTPGWSYILTKYPALVDDMDGNAQPVARRNEQLSWLSAAASLAASTMMVLVVYRIPVVIPALPLVLLPLPARYLNNFCDQALRAGGLIRDCAWLTVIKALLSLTLFGMLAAYAGFWGAIAASALLSLFSGLLYRHRFNLRYPDVLRPVRPWRFA